MFPYIVKKKIFSVYPQTDMQAKQGSLTMILNLESVKNIFEMNDVKINVFIYVDTYIYNQLHFYD